MKVRSLNVLEDDLKKFITNPETTNDLRQAVKMAGEILVHDKKSNYANYAIALHEVAYANKLAPLSDFTKAIKLLEKIIENDPKFIEAYLMLAKIFKETDKNKEVKILSEANIQFPDNYLIMYDLGMTKLFGTGEKEEALYLFSKCVEKLPQIANAWACLGTAYIMNRELEMGKTCFETALSIDPKQFNSMLGLGVYHFECGNFVKAREFYDRSLMVNKNSYYASFNIGILEMLEGKYEIGLKIHEKRDKDSILNRYGGKGYIEMQKEDVKKGDNKKIVVIKEQGYGDDIMFSRYLKPLSELGYEITFAAHPEMIKLLKASPDLDNVNVVHSLPEADPSTFDFRTFSMSIPYLMQDFLVEKPKPLNIDVSRIDTKKLNLSTLITRELNKKNLKVGISWSGNPKHWRDKNRSIPLELFAKLFSIDKVNFFALQKVINKNDEKFIENKNNVINTSDNLHDFLHTAYLASRMDYIFTVDTSLVHLAGSINKKTYLFCPKVPDWRWGLKEKQQWYPSVNLLRQKTVGNWDLPIKNAINLLKNK